MFALKVAPRRIFCIPRRWPFFYTPRRLGQDFRKHGPLNNQRQSPPNARSLQSPVTFARIGWVATAAANMRHSRMRPQSAVLGRAHTKTRVELIGVARGIHRSFWSMIRLRTRELGPPECTRDRNQSRHATLAKLAGSAQRAAGSARR